VASSSVSYEERSTAFRVPREVVFTLPSRLCDNAGTPQDNHV
jgi:hypothetical protein